MSDDDNVMNSGGDANQTAVVYDMDDNVIATGVITVPAYARLDSDDGPDIYLDRVEVDGVHYGYVASAPLTPGEEYEVDSSGTFEEDHSYYQTYSTACFAPGTAILTDMGETPIELLRPGDLVMTRDRGFRPLRWIGCWIGEAGRPAARANWPVTLKGEVPGIGTVYRPLGPVGATSGPCQRHMVRSDVR